MQATVADARFAKPLDIGLIRDLAYNHKALITVEEGSTGGFGALVLHSLAEEGLLDGALAVRTLTMPDAFLEQDKPAAQVAQAGLDSRSIFEVALQLMASVAIRNIQ